MVIKDPHAADVANQKLSTNSLSGNGESRVPAARPLDRLSSSIIDFGILVFVISAAVAPIGAKLELSKLARDTNEAFNYTLIIGFVAAAIAVSYQAIAIGFFGRTVGHRVMGLRVVNIWTGAKPSLAEAAIRSLLWWVSVLTVAPLVGVFSDSYRRILHDKMSDTMVVSEWSQAAELPRPSEINLARALLLCIFLGAGAAIFSMLARAPEQTKQESNLQERAEMASVAQCEKVQSAVMEWPRQNGRLESPLEVGLALFAAGAISESCLDKEAQFALRDAEPTAEAYLARAFISSKQPELSDSYLSEVCVLDPKSQACKLSEILDSLNDKDLTAASTMFRATLPTATSFVKIWAIKHFERALDFESELKIIEDLWSRKNLAEFLSSRRSVALWGMSRKDEARISLASALHVGSAQGSLRLTSWFCSREMERQCPVQMPESCVLFRNKVEENPGLLEDFEPAMTFLKEEECHRGKFTNYAILRNMISNKSALVLVDAANLAHKKKKLEARKLLIDLIHDDDSEDEIVAEAHRRLIDVVENKSELLAIRSRWQELDPLTWSWRSIGYKFFDRYRDLSAYDDALAIGETLRQVEPFNRQWDDDLMVVAYKGRKLETAWKYAHPKAETPVRGIASVAPSEAGEIRRLLEKKFGAP